MVRRALDGVREGLYRAGVEVEARFEVCLDQRFIDDGVVCRRTLVEIDPPKTLGKEIEIF